MMPPPLLPSRLRFPWPVWLGIALVALPVLALALLYPVENWRGKRAWEKCQRELAAKGEVLDWDAYIPPPVPDEQNVFKAPHMAEWFFGRGTNELVPRLDVANLQSFTRHLRTNAVIALSVVTTDDYVDRQKADLVLRYDAPVLSREVAENSSEPADARFVRIPLVQFQDVPLRIAVQNLARQAGLNYVLDPKVSFADPDQPEPVVTFKWQDVTALQVLITLLNNYSLQWTDDPRTGIGIVTWNNSGKVRFVYVDNKLRERIKELIGNSISSTTGEYSRGQSLKAAQGFEIVLASPPRTTPTRVILKAEKRPSLKEVIEFFPTNVVLLTGETMGLRIEAAGDGFQVLLGPPPFTTVEYLAWSDQFLADFAVMREALRRPQARADGDYQEPFTVPIRNYRGLRLVTQTLAQRAQCFLLLDKPDRALRELTLICELNRPLESKPITVVAAMMETAIAGLYVEVVAEGLRRQTWREPQLAVLQEQLRQINLPPLMAGSLRSERAALLRVLKSARTEALASRIDGDFAEGLWKLTRRQSWLPRGWFEQNYAVMANLQQTLLESLDVTNRIVIPAKARRFGHELGGLSEGFRPYTFVAAILIPDFSRAVQSVAYQQARVDEAQLACALERHRLATGAYPETLTALSPQFLETVPHDIIGGQPFKYRREENTRFILYSVGWNETDDHGIARQSQNGSPQMSEGDWVWQPSESSKARLLTAN